MIRREHIKSAETVFSLFLLLMFASLSLMLVIIGSNTYRNVVIKMNTNDELRTSLSYVINKVRWSGKNAEVLTQNGINALCIHEKENDTVYDTYIYTYNGDMYEYYTLSGEAFIPDYGEKITKDVTLLFRESDSILTAELEHKDGTTDTVMLKLNSAGLK